MFPVSLLVLLEIDVYAWTLEVSTRGHIKIRDGHFFGVAALCAAALEI
jgi:hypothetical protein